MTATASPLPTLQHQPDAERDLVLERVIDIPPAAAWAAWTTPALLVQWFTPAPWTTTSCDIDLRPGGQFVTVMRSPEGVENSSEGCILEVVPGEKLVWTSGMTRGYRPLAKDAALAAPFLFSAVLTLAPDASTGGTRYRAHVIHSDAAGSKAHAEMGFHAGWGAALDQMVALMQREWPRA